MRGTRAGAKLPLALLGVLLAVFAFTLWEPRAGRLVWLLEVGPGVAGVAALLLFYRRFPMTALVYAAVFLHILILCYGGYYTYAATPLGEWAKEAFGLARNHYDRVGHLAFGFFPALVIREVLLRATPLRRGGWLAFLVIATVGGFAAFYELIEWWSAEVLSSGVADDFLGSQGDRWDAQWDMFLALLGAAFSLVLLSRAHDRSLAALFARGRSAS